MSKFNYYGRDSKGQKIEGHRHAHSAEGLATQLAEQNITPINITIASEQLSLWKRLFLSVKRKVTTTELQLFTRQMYALNKAGVSINLAITRIAERTQNLYFKNILYSITEDVSAGKTLTSALKRFPECFSDLYVNLVNVGENSGSLDKIFLQLSDYLTLEEKTLRKFKQALRYPLFILFSVLAAALVINALVVPVFADLFSKFDVQLPILTRILIYTSNFFTHYWLVLLGLFLIFLVGLNIYLNTETGKLRWHKFQIRLPLFGWLLKRILLARFTRTFSLVWQAGLPPLTGITLITDTMGNEYFKQQLKIMDTSLSHGETLTQAANNTQLFSPLVLQMLSLGEESGRIEGMLLEVAEFYERETDYDLTRLSEMLEPTLLIIMAVMVLILALGVFLPMWSMAQLVQQYG